MFGDDENSDVDEYGNAAIVTLLKLLKDVFPFGNTSFNKFSDDKSRLQLSMLQQQAMALSEKLMSKIPFHSFKIYYLQNNDFLLTSFALRFLK